MQEFSLDSADAVQTKRMLSESYENRSAGNKFTTYALGSMQEVDPDYTQISLREADRVANQLRNALNRDDIAHSFELQGSVPGNVHIRGISDVDLLVIDERSFGFDAEGPVAKAGGYSLYQGDPIANLQQVRKSAEDTLTEKFPAARVDKSGAKAVNVSGGSLMRPVDVVPSSWYNTVDYQRSGLKRDRGVQVLDKFAGVRIKNYPFKHLHEIDLRDQLSRGGLKKAIRLCKNVKSDSDEEIPLSSYDICAAMWHAEPNSLVAGLSAELRILAETQRHLDHLAMNQAYAMTLVVPDGSRKIFDTTERWLGLMRLSMQMDELAVSVAKEQSRALREQQSPARDVAREALRGAIIY